jgi:hypothetical protein
VTIRLVKDVPVRGRVLDLQGKPIAGVTVRVRGLQWPIKGDLSSFIAALKTRKEGFRPQQEFLVGFRHPYQGWDLDSLYPPVVTGADGRFRVQGVGGERVADLIIAGPTVETKYVYAMTRPGETINVPYLPGREAPVPVPQYTHYGADFDHVAPPSKPVVGVVRDKDTGRPIPGAVLRSYKLAGNLIDERVNFRVAADKDGRYRITGLPYGRGNQFQVGGAPDGPPYVMAIQEAGTSDGLEPVRLDVELKRGVWITGRVTDKATGKPVRCRFDYFVFNDDPSLQGFPGFTTGPQDDRVAADGTFRVAGLPGRGLIAVRAFDDRYLGGVGAERVAGYKGGAPFLTAPSWCSPGAYHALAEVNPPKGAASVTCDLVLDPGRTLTGTVLGPDGRPLAGALMGGLSAADSWAYEPLKGAEFTAAALKPGEPRRLLAVHREKRLAGTLLVRGDEKGPLTVRLQPWGVVTGRLVTPDGKPHTGVEILTLGGDVITAEGVQPRDPDAGSLPGSVKPDKEGKFRLEGLVPGLKYTLSVVRAGYVVFISGSVGDKALTLKAGETRDLGDVEVKPIE